MSPYMTCLILLQLFLLINAQYGLTVHPVNPVVALGGTIQLNCSINCPLGRTSWKGLDTNLNGQFIAPGYSIQTIENARISTEGTKICVGTCPGFSSKSLQTSVYLYVYALPQSLHLYYSVKNDIFYLHCSMKDTYPHVSEISCYRGSKKLDDPIEEKVEEKGEDLTTVTWSWEVHDEDRIAETLYRCEAKVVLGDHELKREGTLMIPNKEETTASSTSQMAVTLSRSLETSYVKATITASNDPQTRSGKQENTTAGNGLSAFLSNMTNTLRTTMVSLGTQETVLTTRIPKTYPSRTGVTHPPTTSQDVPQIESRLRPTAEEDPRVKTKAQYGLTVNPLNPVVALGGTIQLNCSINCPLGRTSWKGLDTNLNGQFIAPGYSIQTIENATISTEGTRICVGTCPGFSSKSLQTSVYLYVYALPQSLHLNYSMKNDIFYLHCSMKDTYPHVSEINCYRGSKKLDDPIEEKVEDEGEDLTTVTWSWEVHDEDRIAETLYRCEAKVVLDDHELKREGTLMIPNKEETTAFSTSQMAVTLSRSLETSYVKATITASNDPQTRSGTHENTTAGNGLSAFLSNMTNTLRTTMVSLGTQETVLTTRIPKTYPSRTGVTHPPTTSQDVPQINSTLRPTAEEDPRVKTKDGLSLMLMIAPAAGLAGTILLSLQIWKQLNRKGFFQPKQIDWSGVKEGTKSQDHITSLQAVHSHYASIKMMYTQCTDTTKHILS
ncbi:mucosal addressin cell adhesion molecule 1 [Mixophyes fleayi]|uniref:mucosal addressin cell adhesion molecule 1 n=1 Tax=Mixophyes fleayi TaxID=3061075 RepID=UPI003F4DEAA8